MDITCQYCGHSGLKHEKRGECTGFFVDNGEVYHCDCAGFFPKSLIIKWTLDLDHSFSLALGAVSYRTDKNMALDIAEEFLNELREKIQELNKEQVEEFYKELRKD